MHAWWHKGRERRTAIRMFFMHRIHYAGILVALMVLFSGFAWFGIYQPPAFFPVRTIITIPEGVTLNEAAHILKDEQVIHSTIAFRVIAPRVNSSSTSVIAGDYYFDEPLTIDAVARRVTSGVFGLEPIKVTIPEGATTYQMADIFADTYERFDKDMFMLLAVEKEGYLFPDTYLFPPNVTTTEIINTLERTFYERLRTIEDRVAEFGRPVHEVVTMASLLEKEANDFEERREIAGVLWHRIDIGMPLQVDAVFGFIEKTETFSPLLSDLEVDSLYNTYKYGGLPPGPIGSPSLEALTAAVTPDETDALFYLHGRDGVLRLAVTYDEHLANRRKYLD